MRFDLDLFTALNDEYASKPLYTGARDLGDRSAMESQGSKRARTLQSRYKVRGLRCLEIGCGRGEVGVALSTEYGCSVTGLDITEYPEWAARQSDALQLRKLDVTSEDYAELGQFDFICSFAVWEHMHHPLAAIRAAFALLKPGGRIYLSANLYRGPKASHRYREIYFPWPHLLFEDRVFEEYYVRLRGKPARPAWVNRLVAEQYLHYFREAGFNIDKIWYNETPIDEAFYQRFEPVLGRYPRVDLMRDFIHADLSKP